MDRRREPCLARIRWIAALVVATLALAASPLSAATYFPPPEGQGGWRSLVPLNTAPSAAQKTAVRSTGKVDWDKLKRAHDYSRSHASDSAVVVIRNGYVVGEWGSRSARGLASISKSLTGLTMARLFDMSAAGQLPKSLAPGSYAYSYLPPSWAPAGSRKRQIRLRHMLTMTSGLQPDDHPGASDYRDVILGLPSQHAPGTRWAYASAPVDLLSLIVMDVTGKTLREVFNQQIAAPLGIPAITWNEFAGSPVTGASSKAQLRARDLARIGYLMMRDGMWAGQRVISEARVNAMLDGDQSAGATFQATPNSPFRIDANPQKFYGQLWWTNRTRTALGGPVPADAFYAHGFTEKLLVVVPSRNLVVVRLGSAPRSLPSFKREFMARVMNALI